MTRAMKAASWASVLVMSLRDREEGDEEQQRQQGHQDEDDRGGLPEAHRPGHETGELHWWFCLL